TASSTASRIASTTASRAASRAASPAKSGAAEPSEPVATKPSASKPSASAPPAGCDHHSDQGGPVASDFIKINDVTTRVSEATPGRDAAKGTFVSACGRNEENHRNSDNFIVAPGVTNGAHHVHDYVGNRSTDGFSTNDSLAAAGTTCEGGDQSTYFWPVLRYKAKAGPDASAPGGGQDGNIGTILRP